MEWILTTVPALFSIFCYFTQFKLDKLFNIQLLFVFGHNALMWQVFSASRYVCDRCIVAFHISIEYLFISAFLILQKILFQAAISLADMWNVIGAAYMCCQAILHHSGMVGLLQCRLKSYCLKTQFQHPVGLSVNANDNL